MSLCSPPHLQSPRPPALNGHPCAISLWLASNNPSQRGPIKLVCSSHPTWLYLFPWSGSNPSSPLYHANRTYRQKEENEKKSSCLLLILEIKLPSELALKPSHSCRYLGCAALRGIHPSQGPRPLRGIPPPAILTSLLSLCTEGSSILFLLSLTSWGVHPSSFPSLIT